MWQCEHQYYQYHETPKDISSTEERIRQRAHELYLKRAGREGSELDDWLQAEGEIQEQDKEG